MAGGAVIQELSESRGGLAKNSPEPEGAVGRGSVILGPSRAMPADASAGAVIPELSALGDTGVYSFGALRRGGMRN